jgi:hypothetical protein
VSYSSAEKTGISIGGLPGSLYADYLTANVITDNPTGYKLTIESSEPNLKCIDGANTYWLNALTGAPSATLNNTWGYGVGTGTGGLTQPSTWTGVTTLPITCDNYGYATDPDDGRDTVLWFGTQFDYTLPACSSYGGTVTITATSN